MHTRAQVRNGLNEWSHRDPDDRLADRAHMRVIRRLGCWGAMRVHPLPLGGQQPARNWLLHRRVSSRSGRKPMSRRVATDVPNVVRPLAPCGDHQDLGRQDLFSAHVRCQGSLGWQLRTERQNREYPSVHKFQELGRRGVHPKYGKICQALRVKQITALALDGQKRPCKVRSSNAGSLMKPSFFAQRKQRVDSPCLSRRHKQAAAGWH